MVDVILVGLSVGGYLLARKRQKEQAPSPLSTKKIAFLGIIIGLSSALMLLGFPIIPGFHFLKVELSDYGSYLGRAQGCFEVREKTGKVERYPHFDNEIGEAVLKSGSYVSVDALIDLALWNIDTYIVTRHNRVVALLRNLEDDNHVETRIAQYQALENGKGIQIAKQLVLSKLEGNQMVLNKWGLDPFDMDLIRRQISTIPAKELKLFRRRLLAVEANCAKNYFERIFSLFPENIRPETRKTRMAYDGINNVFNFGYYVLKCRVHKALIKAKLEPYLGFLHAVRSDNAGLVCDFMEPYRYLIDNLLIERCQKERLCRRYRLHDEPSNGQKNTSM
jgi:CRISPR-associated protein Cas1